MQLRQSYESTITNGNQTLHFFVLPKRSFSTQKTYEPSSVFNDLTEFQELAQVDPAYTAHALAAILDQQSPSSTTPRGPTISAEKSDALRSSFINAGQSPHFAFAQQVAFSHVVPFEASPLTDEVLASIIAGSSVVAIGAKLGILAFGATSGPALLVAAAAGIVVVVASVELGKAIAKRFMD